MNAYPSIIHKTITIHAPVSAVWNALTEPQLMKAWMLDTEINIVTDWIVGNPFRIIGNLHWTDFETRGSVLQFDPGKVVSYSFLSSLSELRDDPENYSIIEFSLTARPNETTVDLTLRNFPTEVIYRHLLFYWTVTLQELKKFAER